MKSDILQLGRATFEPKTLSLSDQSGTTIELRQKSMEVLLCLAGAPGELVTKETILNTVWPDVTVAEEGLVQCVADIRRAIGDDGKRIIQTVPRKGYRLNPAARRGVARLPMAAAAVVAFFLIAGAALWVYGGWSGGNSGPPVVAVLAFDDLSPGDNNGALGDILSEGIINNLARFPQFKVIARNSSFQFRDGARDMREIGKVLGADYILEGSQNYDGSDVRVSVQLIDAGSGTLVFADRIDRPLGDIFSAQDDIVRRIATAIGVSVIFDAPRLRGSDDVSALMLNLQARRYMQNFSKENFEKAYALQQSSAERFPESPWGHIGLALLLRAAASWGWLDEPRDVLLAQAEAHAKKALTLDPGNYMAHFARARVQQENGEIEASIQRYERAIELNPSDSSMLIGLSEPLLYLGDNERALEVLAEAQEIDPLHGDWLYWQQGWAFWQTQECEKGVQAMTSMAAPPLTSQRMLAGLYACLGDKENAAAALQVFTEQRPEWDMKVEIESLSDKWTAPGAAERWLDDMGFAGMRE